MIILRNIKEYLYKRKLRRKYFKEHKSYKNCLWCGKELIEMKRKFCSQTCTGKYWSKVYKGEITRNVPKWFLDKKKMPKKKELKEENLKKYAHNVAFKSIKTGKNMRCMICKQNSNILNRHHEDYNQAKLVMLVCPKCHGFVRRFQNIKRRLFNNHKLKGGNKK